MWGQGPAGIGLRPKHQRKFSPCSRLDNPIQFSTHLPVARAEWLSLLVEEQLDVHKGSAGDSGRFLKRLFQKWQQSSGSQFVSSRELCLWQRSSLEGETGAISFGVWRAVRATDLWPTAAEVTEGVWVCARGELRCCCAVDATCCWTATPRRFGNCTVAFHPERAKGGE